MKNTILILLLIFFISNCKRDRCSPNYTPGNKIDSLKISDSVKAELPDIKNDSFWYASNTGDTAILVCTEIKDVYTEEYYQNLGSADCPKKWLRYHEAMHYNYGTNSKKLNYVKILVYYSSFDNSIGLEISINEKWGSANWNNLPFSYSDSINLYGELVKGNYLEPKIILFNRKFGIIGIDLKQGEKWLLFKIT